MSPAETLLLLASLLTVAVWALAHYTRRWLHR